MPAFFDAHLYDLANAELWVGVGLLIFLGILVAAGVPKIAARALDAKAVKIQSDLDEAARLRAEAEALLAQIRKEKADAEAQAAEMMAQAEADARRMEAETKVRLEETLTRRQQMAERRIAQAEAVLAARLAGQAKDPLVDQAIAQIGGRLN